MKERVWYFDILRIFATFMVIVLHISAQNIGNVSVSSFEWNVFNIFDSLTRWTVPVFVMISGALFLDAENSVGKIYKKYILRMITAFVFWSAIYAMFGMAQGNCGIKDAIWNFFVGHVHMWFLYMIIGVYMLIPILKRIVETKSVMQYFLLLAFVFACVIPQGINVLSYIYPRLEKLATTILGQVDLGIVTGFAFYFVLGFCLNKIEISKKMQKIIYMCGVIGLFITIVMTQVISQLCGVTKTDFYGNFTVNVLFMSIAIFVFFKQKVAVEPKQSVTVLISKMSKYSFGVYLVHMLIIDVFDKVLNFNTLSFNPLLSIPIIASITFVISAFVSGLLNHVPLLKKYIV